MNGSEDLLASLAAAIPGRESFKVFQKLSQTSKTLQNFKNFDFFSKTDLNQILELTTLKKSENISKTRKKCKFFNLISISLQVYASFFFESISKFFAELQKFVDWRCHWLKLMVVPDMKSRNNLLWLYIQNNVRYHLYSNDTVSHLLFFPFSSLFHLRRPIFISAFLPLWLIASFGYIRFT